MQAHASSRFLCVCLCRDDLFFTRSRALKYTHARVAGRAQLWAKKRKEKKRTGKRREKKGKEGKKGDELKR